MVFTIVWVLGFLAVVALIYVGFWLRRRRASQESSHHETEQPPEVAAPAPILRMEERGTQTVVVKQGSLTVQVQEAVYASGVRPSVPRDPRAAGPMVDSSPTMYIHIKAKLTPTGKVQLSAIQLLAYGQEFPCTDVPEYPLEEEQTLVLHFKAPASSLEPALSQGASLSYMKIVAPTLDVRSNPFVLKPAGHSLT